MQYDLSKAKRLIKECLETQNPVLDLGNCGITDLEDLPGLFHCIHIETLILSSNWQELTPLGIKRHLSQNIGPVNRLQFIPKKISNLIQLKKLYLAHLFSTTSYPNVSNLKQLKNLQLLDLSYNKISNFIFLKKLTRLQFLYISGNKVTSISFLKNLIHLRHLKLSSNKISNISCLEQLTNLQLLDIGFNKISDISCLGKISNLRLLYLSSNLISNFTFLKNLTHLISLHLSYNKISNISFLVKLTRLQCLDISDNQISNGNILKELKELIYLNFSNNSITDYSVLSELKKLRTLIIRDTQISNYNFLKEILKLEELNLIGNRISDISFLEDLTSLKELYLSDNRIENFRPLKKLKNLQVLYLSKCEINDYSFLLGLSKLKKLNISNNGIVATSILENLVTLKELNISNNQIEDISFLAKLIRLQSLNLSSNLISNISVLEDLQDLQKLELNDNRISHIPHKLLMHFFYYSFQFFYPWEKGISLKSNPIVSPPIEILKRGRYEVIKYFENIKEQGKAYLYEAKILLVGDGGAGKTSLARKLKNLNSSMPKSGEDRTKGIAIQALSIKNFKKPEVPFLMNVWDFGGQGYYHSTHQFFLTKRSLYVLLNNTRINKTDFNDWLQTISLFSDNSPVILVENEVGGSKSDLDLRGLRQYFDNILYVREADISKTDDGRLEKLIRDIQIEIQRLDHIGTELPKQWVKIREDLKEEAENKAYITDKEFKTICKHNQVVKKDEIRRLGGLFHDLGVFLHFTDDPILKRIVILQNTWATKGVYAILDNNSVRLQNGFFTIVQAESIWEDTLYEDMHYELVGLMAKFKLCYRVPYSNPAAFISPNLLPVEKPDYAWDPQQNLIIQYDYEFMPKGLLGMLIVELHRYVKDIKKLAWRNGCIFHYQDTDAQVIETYGKKKLEIRIKGAHCIHLSSIIISEIDKLHDTFEQIKVKKLVPCNCHLCSQADVPEFYEYDKLMRRREKKKFIIECPESFEDVNVLKILEASYNKELAKEPTIKQLVKDGKIKEAIDVYEQDYPKEGILLMSRFSIAKQDFDSGKMSREDWDTIRNRIMASLLRPD